MGTYARGRAPLGPDLLGHSADCSWLPSPLKPALGPDEVHVWRASLELPAWRVQALRATLAPDEAARAARYRFAADGGRFVVGRGLLRAILARYVDSSPERLRFSYNPYGKPALSGCFEQAAITFNLSHSDGLALYAISRLRPVGVDLERLRSDFQCEEIASRFFSADEQAALLALPPALRHAAFFACWTRKEAYIKAQGQGLSLPLDSFDVSLSPHEPVQLIRTRYFPQDVSRWSLQELSPAPGYAAALAAAGPDWRLRCWDYSE